MPVRRGTFPGVASSESDPRRVRVGEGSNHFRRDLGPITLWKVRLIERRHSIVVLGLVVTLQHDAALVDCLGSDADTGATATGSLEVSAKSPDPGVAACTSTSSPPFMQPLWL